MSWARHEPSALRPRSVLCELHSSPATGRCSRPSTRRSSSRRSCAASSRTSTDVEIVVAPPFTALHAVAEALRNTNVGVAAQDLYWEREGAFTGEVSAPMIKEAGAEYVIIGHSERRRLFGETDATVNRKTSPRSRAGLTPIVCVGETLEERERNETLAVLDRQIKDGLDGLTRRAGRRARRRLRAGLGDRHRPQRDAGAGRRGARAHPRAAAAVVRRRRRRRCHVIYGGSVKPDNIAELMREPDVDGALVGGASLDVRSFVAIVTRSRPGCGIIGVSEQSSGDMLYYLLTTVYVLVCLVLLLVILLQQGKGGDMASAFGGGSSQTAFGARGGATRAVEEPRRSPCCSCSARSCCGIIGQTRSGVRCSAATRRAVAAPDAAPAAPAPRPTAPAPTPAPAATPATEQPTPKAPRPAE